MTLQTHTWEQALLSLAYEATQSVNQSDSAHGKPAFPPELLERSYAHCDALTALHSRSFHLASALLPPGKRRAARALYAFCRVSDDIVDCATDNVEQSLTRWRANVLNANPPAEDLVAVAWTHARLRYDVPLRYAEQLIDGVARDVHQNRYQSFDDLTAYCYGVASTVGLMSMHIIGHAGAHAIPYAIKLGVALQLTNILRDVAEDWRVGRIYLPLDELSAFDLCEEDIARGEVTERWRAFMRFQIERNRKLYAEAMPGISLLDPNGRFAITAAAELYEAILADIEQHDYDIFTRRAFVSKWGKLRMLPGIWWHSRRVRI